MYTYIFTYVVYAVYTCTSMFLCVKVHASSHVSACVCVCVYVQGHKHTTWLLVFLCRIRPSGECQTAV